MSVRVQGSDSDDAEVRSSFQGLSSRVAGVDNVELSCGSLVALEMREDLGRLPKLCGSAEELVRLKHGGICAQDRFQGLL